MMAVATPAADAISRGVPIEFAGVNHSFLHGDRVVLWEAERPTVIFVTHDLEEAILLSDRVVLMASRPGRIVADIPIELERPRTQEMRTNSALFREYFTLLADKLRHEVQVAEEQRRAESDE